ncbi:hypothetical protein C0989_006172 [Termitomyces sp. Mn162]|nr:hypothetical protein C0989_006172 [Termitomyces sp. Mn162]
MSANPTSSNPNSSSSLAKLTSISTLTLSLLLERQRAQTLPSFSSPSPSLNPNSNSLVQNISTPSSISSSSSSTPTPTPAAQAKDSLHFTQITKNFVRLREGIHELERKDGKTEATRLLRTQYERMRGMLGDERGLVDSLQDEEQQQQVIAPQPTVPKPTPKVLVEPVSVYTPYTDEDPASGVDNEDDNGILLQQRRMMDEQDQHLSRLSHSITRQHHISLQINDELDVHRGLLEELDTDLERTEGRLGRARRGLERVGRGVRGNDMNNGEEKGPRFRRGF